MGDMADYDIVQGMDMIIAHLSGHCSQDCVYCNEDEENEDETD